MRLIILSIILLFSSLSFGQDLLNTRLRKVGGSKASVYFDSGIFYHGGPKKTSSLKAIRHSYVSSRGYERVVFDFQTSQVPRIYGHISSQEKVLYIDLFDTTIAGDLGSFGNSQFVDKIHFFPLSRDSLSVELHFKHNVSVDIFRLASPGRFVIDIKK